MSVFIIKPVNFPMNSPAPLRDDLTDQQNLIFTKRCQDQLRLESLLGEFIFYLSFSVQERG